MEQRKLGHHSVGAIGLGGMTMSQDPVPGPERAEATVHAALDAGVTLVDTADAYTPDGEYGHNERLLAAAMRTYGDTSEVIVATKGGHTRAGAQWHVDGRPEYLRMACERSLRALGLEAIDLYQHHRPDPAVPYAETMGAMQELLDAGLIRAAGISNADPGQIREAHAILGDGLVSVQNQLNPVFRTSLPELEVCDELGLTFIPWSPLRGINSPTDGGPHAAFAEVAERHGASAQQVTLAWLMALSPSVVPIPGASRPESIGDSVGAVDVELSRDEMAALSQV